MKGGGSSHLHVQRVTRALFKGKTDGSHAWRVFSDGMLGLALSHPEAEAWQRFKMHCLQVRYIHLAMPCGSSHDHTSTSPSNSELLLIGCVCYCC